MSFNIGPESRRQLTRMAAVWEQGQHVLVSGGTGSGKSLLTRQLVDIRLNRGGYVVVFVGKLTPDDTILQEYKGFTRWTKWKRNPGRTNAVLLWPDTSKAKNVREARDIQREVFQHALDEIAKSGKWTVDFDEGLYMCDPKFMNMADDIALLHFMGRSSRVTNIVNTQRPSHIPLVIYGSVAHAFIGRTREASDLKRLAELGGKESSKYMASKIASQGQHDFLWVPVAKDWDPETVNLEK